MGIGQGDAAVHGACPLCGTDGGEIVARHSDLRVVRTDEGGFAAFYRVIWNAHVAEFSDLSAADRARCMDAVVRVEQALREHLQPVKVNIASLGNVVPHLHWHVVARFAWDSHYPSPVWAQAQREPDAEAVRAVVSARVALHQAIARTLPA